MGVRLGNPLGQLVVMADNPGGIVKRIICEAVSLVAACTVVAGLVVLCVCQEVGR